MNELKYVGCEKFTVSSGKNNYALHNIPKDSSLFESNAVYLMQDSEGRSVVIEEPDAPNQ